MKKTLLSIFAVAMLMIASTVGNAQTTYSMVTSESELEAGAQYLLIGYDDAGAAYVMSYQKPNNRHAVDIEVVNDVVTAIVATDPNDVTSPYEITLGGTPGAWTLFDPVKNGYLYAPGGGNYLKTQTTLDDKGKWTISQSVTDAGFVPVSNGGVEQCYMRFNINNSGTGTPLFGCYKESSNVSATVYFFKAGGTAQPDPEPADYPEDFDAALEENSVFLSWTTVASPAGPTPRGYLIVGSTGSINVPVDGTPVANDLNASDGRVAYNVMYGVEEFTFNQLPGNCTMHFAIFPYTNAQSNINYKTDGNYPRAEVTIGDTYCLLLSDFANGLEPFDGVNISGDQQWTTGVYDGVYFAKMNGYAGGAHANEDWLITPNLAPNGNYETVVLSFMNAYKYDGDPLKVYMSDDYNGVDNPLECSWDDVTSLFDWSSGEFEWVTTSAALPVGRSTKLYVAFVYTSTDEAASTWEIADVKVQASGFDAVADHVVTTMEVYPNPAHEMLSFCLENQAQVSVFDVTGRMVSQMNMAAGEGRYQVSDLENGVYFLNVNYVDGKKEVARFVKF